MKLSKLVQYKNQLDLLSTSTAQAGVKQELDKITDALSLINQPTDLFDQHKLGLTQIFKLFEKDLDDLKKQLNEVIAEAEKPMFQQNYRLYEQGKEQIDNEELYRDNIEYTLNRKLDINEETYQLFLARVSRYTDWRHPAMIIHPGNTSFINSMVANDPLYAVDENYDLLHPAVSQFNEVYQNRLRVSTVIENTDNPILEKIPNGQLGLCVAYNFFNYKPFEIVKQYLTEIYQKLKPGGTLVMTFNDCDRYPAVMLAEQCYAAYTPGNMLRYWAEHVGFNEVFCYHDAGPITWIELQKPGELTSLRGGQALAKILPKPVA
jgi:SAM-dependent methyltransferase